MQPLYLAASLTRDAPSTRSTIKRARRLIDCTAGAKLLHIQTFDISASCPPTIPLFLPYFPPFTGNRYQRWQRQQQCPAMLAFPCPMALQEPQDNGAETRRVLHWEADPAVLLLRATARLVMMRATKASRTTRSPTAAQQTHRTSPRSRTNSECWSRSTLKTSLRGMRALYSPCRCFDPR